MKCLQYIINTEYDHGEITVVTSQRCIDELTKNR